MRATDTKSPMETVIAFVEGFDIVIMDARESSVLLCGSRDPKHVVRMLEARHDWEIGRNPMQTIDSEFDFYYVRIPRSYTVKRVVAILRAIFPGLEVE